MWSNTLPAILGRWGLFAGLMLLVGAWGFRALIAGPGERGAEGAPPVEPAVRHAVRGTVLVGGALLLAGVLVRLGMQVLDFLEPSEPAGEQIAFLVGGTFWGRIWIAQAVLALVTLPLLAAWLPGAVTRGRVALCGILVLPGAAMPALSGHAVASERFAAAAVLADTAHVVASGLWLGTLLVLVAAALKLPDSEGDRDRAVRAWIEPFHRLAVGSVAVVLATGLFATWLHASPAVLVRTDWGFALLAKLVLVAGVLALGWHSGWKLRNDLHRPGMPGRLLDSALLELVAAQLVLLATAVLVALSPVLDVHDGP